MLKHSSPINVVRFITFVPQNTVLVYLCMNIRVESFILSRFRNLNNSHRKAGIVVGTPIAEYIVLKPINIHYIC